MNTNEPKSGVKSSKQGICICTHKQTNKHEDCVCLEFESSCTKGDDERVSVRVLFTVFMRRMRVNEEKENKRPVD